MNKKYISHPPVVIPNMMAAYVSPETGHIFISQAMLFTITTTSIDLDTGKTLVESSEVHSIDYEFGFLSPVINSSNFICFADSKQTEAEIATEWEEPIKEYLKKNPVTQKEPQVNP